jgi:rhamnose transport system permease protein
MRHRHRAELSVALAIALLASVLALAAPAYFQAGHLTSLLLANLPVLLVAVGLTLVMLTGEIDISVGSVFAIASVVAGVLATSGVPLPLALAAAPLTGALLGATNGVLVGALGIPSIVATLATMVAWRDGLRWSTGGVWVQDLPAGFQWIGLSQRSYPFGAAVIALSVAVALSFGLRHLAAGRAVYATGSNPEAARLAGIDVGRLRLAVFTLAGLLTGLAALLNTVRFSQIPSNAGIGLEMKVIAAILVGGTAITGGRGSVIGTALGVALLGMIGPALTFLGASAYWERAIQGAIILVAVGVEATRRAPIVGGQVFRRGEPGRPGGSTRVAAGRPS